MRRQLIICFITFLLSLILLPGEYRKVHGQTPGPVFIEDFNDGTADGLVVVSGTWTVINQQLHVSQSPNFDTVVTQTATGTDYIAEVKTTHLSGYTSTGLLVRYQDINHYYEIVMDFFAQSIQAQPARALAIYKISTSPTQAGALSTFIQPVPSMPYLHLLAGKFFPIQLNRVYTLRVEVVGSTISVFVDGNLELSVTDTDNPYLVGKIGLYSFRTEALFDDFLVNPSSAVPVAIAGTSLDGNNMLQLDGSLSSDPNNDPLTFSWQIEGELAPRLGRIVSIADLAVGNYKVTLTVSDGVNSSTDTMPFGVPARAGIVVPTTNSLQQATLWIKGLITGFPGTSFDAPTPQARENRRKALLNMLDKVFTSIGIGDYQAAVEQLRDILDKTDGLGPLLDSAPDWITGTDAQVTANAVSHLIADLLWICPECR